MKKRDKDLTTERNLQVVGFILLIVSIMFMVGYWLSEKQDKDESESVEMQGYHGAIYDDKLDALVIKESPKQN